MRRPAFVFGGKNRGSVLSSLFAFAQDSERRMGAGKRGGLKQGLVESSVGVLEKLVQFLRA